MANHFGSLNSLRVGSQTYAIHRLDAVTALFPQAARLPYSLKILLENLLRTEDGVTVRPDDVKALACWDPKAAPDKEIAFTPARVLMQDFTGVPAIVDLAAMRDAMRKMGGDPKKINPLQPAELVIDHSVQVDDFGNGLAFRHNAEMEYKRNRERYAFLRWGQKAFRNFAVVPPETGIVHQVNLEYLARVVFTSPASPHPLAYPDTLVGTDSHTTMINGLGVLGWGVGGIEAEAAMLGQPVSMLIPEVVGFKLQGRLPEGATATDLVLTVTEILRKKGVVGKFVEFYGEGLADLALADRATIANMAPEYGATCGIFPVDAETLRYLRFSGRPESLVQLVEAYTKEQGLFHTASTPEAAYSDTLTLDLKTVEPSLAGPSRPQDRVRLGDVKRSFAMRMPSLLGGPRGTDEALEEQNVFGALAKAGNRVWATIAELAKETKLSEDRVRQVLAKYSNRKVVFQHPNQPDTWALWQNLSEAEIQRLASVPITVEGREHYLHQGSAVIAAITSCTNTSNPSVMLAAGLLAKKAVEKGLSVKPWVKTSLAPGSKVVTDYLADAGVTPYLEKLKFNLVGYGCTTCLAAGTPVLLANGTARRIEQMPNAGGAVLWGPTSEKRLGMAMQAEAEAKGEQECVRLVLQDGRALVCTPDHEILSADRGWVRADQLVTGQDQVVVGLEAPLDEPRADEAGYLLTVGDLRLTLGTPQERLRTLAFARLLGHLLGDGSISVLGQGRINVGQIVDREMVLNDVELLTGKRPAATRYDDRKWAIVLPMALTEAITRLPGVRTGRRIDQPPTLPAFVLEEKCPVAVVREFLGGVFGADGQAPILHRLSERPEDAILEAPAFSQSARPEHVEQLEQLMRDLLRLLGRCGVRTEGVNLLKYETRRSDSTYPAAQDGSPRIEVRFQLPDGLSFVERVGFRYCVDKALRASAAAVYWRTVAKINKQRLWMSLRLQELRRVRPELSFSKARKLAAAELTQRETIVFPHYSLLEGHDRFDRLPQPEDRTFRPLHRDSCGFPSPVEVLEQLGVRDWFAPLLAREETDYSKRYCVEKTSETLPTMTLRVLDRRPAGKHPVFDLSVEGLHAFVAGTVSVSNCIGNAGPLPEPVSKGIESGKLVVASVLSGNRNFEGRIHGEVRANYLASPPLVVAYALAGRVDIDLKNEPLGTDSKGQPVFLKDVWPTRQEIDDAVRKSVRSEMFQKQYGAVYDGDEHWKSLPVPLGDLFQWEPDSTYVRHPPYFESMSAEPPPVRDIRGARVLAVLGDSITTDHISPAGSIKANSPAGKYLDRAWRAAQRFQLLRLAARQPRGDGARHLRQRPAQEPAGPRHRGRRHPSPARWRRHVDLRCRDAVRAGERAAADPGRQGVRLRLLARLGGQGAEAAGRACGDRRELRAHPPQQPGGHGHSAAAIPRRRERGQPGAERRGGLRSGGPAGPAGHRTGRRQGDHRSGQAGGRQREDVPGARAN